MIYVFEQENDLLYAFAERPYRVGDRVTVDGLLYEVIDSTPNDIITYLSLLPC